MPRANFIKATEVWIPTPDRKHIDLEAGLYGEMDYFEAISRGMRFSFGEGLPGTTWAEGHPIVLKNLMNSYFRRGDIAMTEGIECAVSVPIFVGDDLKAVIVFFCGGNRFHVGALEIWHANPGEPQMGLADGYFGRAEKFEFASRHTKFPRKMGLPGKVWDSGMPVVMDDLGKGSDFLRQDSAEKVGINRAVGIPCASRSADDWVLTFLSAKNSPIAQRIECWLPDPETGAFRYSAGYCEYETDLADIYEDTLLAADAGPFGKARAKGTPVVVRDLSKEREPILRAASDAGLESMIAVPVFSSGAFRAIIAIYL